MPTGIVGSIIQSNAAGDAARMQADAAGRANDLQYQMYQQQQAANEPFRQAGINALYGAGGMFRRKDGGSGLALSDLSGERAKYIQDAVDRAGNGGGFIGGFADMARTKAEKDWDSSHRQPSVDASQYELDPELTRKFGMSDFQQDPGYQFRMQEGQKALENSASARGGTFSGAQAKALSQYGQNFASNEYNSAYNRFNNDQTNRFNRLSALSGMGQTANAQMGAAGQNYANQAGSNMMGAANAQGAASMASANAWGNTLSGLGKMGMQYGMLSGMGAFKGNGALYKG